MGDGTTSRLLGRDLELDAVLESWSEAGSPVSLHHVVGGDAGMGKTRFVSTIADEVSSRGWRTLVGHCVDSESTVPYLPFSEAWGRVASDEPEMFESIVADVPDVAGLLPGRRLLGGSHVHAHETLEQGALFDGMHAALERLAEESPTLLVVEDVHWAGRSTADLLTVLFSRPFRNPLCIVTTSRSDYLHRRHPLHKTFAEWGRLPSVRRLELAPLGEEQIESLVAQVGTQLGPARLREVVTRSGGNPFFAEELASADGEARLPVDLADVLLLRLEDLTAEEVSVVRAASCAGRQVSHRLLSAVVEGDRTLVDGALRAAVEANLLVLEGRESYGFRHALLAEAVCNDLLPGEREAIHARYAAALATGRASGTAAELARHAWLGGDLSTALAASVAAGDEAMGVGGPEEAADHFETALGLIEEGVPAGPDVDEVSVLLRCGRALDAAGRADRAFALLFGRLEDPVRLAPEQRAALHLCIAEIADDANSVGKDLNPYEISLRSSAQALALLGDGTSPLRARASEVRARILMRFRHLEEAVSLATDALRMADDLGLARVRIDAQIDLLETRLETNPDWREHPGETLRAIEELEEEAARIAYLDGQLRLSNLGTFMSYSACDRASAERFSRRTMKIAEATHRPWTQYAAIARNTLLFDAVSDGRWGLAHQLTEEVEQDPPPIEGDYLRAYRAILAVREGDLETAERLVLERREGWSPADPLAALTGAPGIEALAATHGLDAAWDWYETVLSWNPVPQPRSSQGENLRAMGRLWLAGILLMVVNDRLDQADREVWESRISQVVEEVEDARDLHRPHPLDWRYGWGPWEARFEAELAVFRGEEPTSWPDAIAAFDEAGLIYEAARTRARSGIPEEVARGRSMLQELGAGARSEPVPLGESLTPRENEILALVADGLSNKEIGKRLFISTKTVSVHVSNILAKLQVASRTEAAAQYHRAARND